jgi:hypothetical protein
VKRIGEREPQFQRLYLMRCLRTRWNDIVVQQEGRQDAAARGYFRGRRSGKDRLESAAMLKIPHALSAYPVER